MGDSEYYFGSDATPFLEFTKRCIYLNDNEMFIVNLKKGLTLREIKKDSIIDPYIQELKQNIEEVEKGGYDHFMLKEIFEQPKNIVDATRGRILDNYKIKIKYFFISFITFLISLWLNMFTNFSILPLRVAIITGFIFSLYISQYSTRCLKSSSSSIFFI